MKKKIKLLRIINTLNPRDGGPANAIINNSIELSKKGFDIEILTNDTLKSNYVRHNNKIKIINLGPAIGNYGFNLKQIFWLYKYKDHYDKFFLHGIWEFKNILARIFLKNRYYVFSHGQLDPYFESEYFKKIKKKIYWILFEKQNLINANALLLTSQNERKNLNNTFVNTRGINKKVITYGISLPKYNHNKGSYLFKTKFKKLHNKPFLLFLGRFHKKKGCEILLKSIPKIVNFNKNILFLLAGPNNSYKDYLIKLAKKLKIEQNIIWSDMINGNLKWATLKKSEGMVLSSHGENFGVSLVESLSMKKPVITTNKVNIYDKIKFLKAGIITNDNEESFSTGVIKFLNLSKSKKNKMKKQAFKCFKSYFNLSDLDQYISILKK
tara:strand:+ start:6655 stop:7800 length:1146 start_codon:yes stop_codon:yes gene_type:complete